MQYVDLTASTEGLSDCSWILAYATVDVPLEQTLAAVAAAQPGVPVFGCTSFQGVFSPTGFTRGMHALAAGRDEPIRAIPVLRAVGAAQARKEACAAALEIQNALGCEPSTILMHATPGFEERILSGIDDAFPSAAPPVYGGSAGDDEMNGAWKVFLGTQIISEGFVLVGFSSSGRVLGSFVSGYAPTKTRGKVTSACDRIVQSIDHLPAAKVYNEWTHGSIQNQLGGGVVIHQTALKPLGRVVDKVGSMSRYLLSHPHQVLADGALWFFCDMKLGDELVLMLGTDTALLERTNQALNRALFSKDEVKNLAGGILIYCGGCVSVVGAKMPQVTESFRQQMRGAPFVGAATFGEQGCFAGRPAFNRHGNLMCDTIVFEA
jgi:hypothetical protein